MFPIKTVVIICIHQDPTMLEWHIQNFLTYADESIGLVIHHNLKDLPSQTIFVSSNILVTCNVVKTERHTSMMLLKGFVAAMSIALANFPALEKMVLVSSGSGFFKSLQNLPDAALGLYDEPHEAYSATLLGRIHEIEKERHVEPWAHWGAVDEDTFLQSILVKRRFKWIRSSQLSGQVIPRRVAEMIVEDLADIPRIPYCCEEVYFSTYVYNDSLVNNVSVHKPIVYIDWKGQYEVKTKFQVERAFREGACGVCKLSDNSKEREWLNEAVKDLPRSKYPRLKFEDTEQLTDLLSVGSEQLVDS